MQDFPERWKMDLEARLDADQHRENAQKYQRFESLLRHTGLEIQTPSTPAGHHQHRPDIVDLKESALFASKRTLR